MIKKKGILRPGFNPRHVVSSSCGERVLLGAFERRVAIYSLADRKMSACFDTVFDFGGERLALSDQLDGVLAASYQNDCIAFYSAKDGNMLWTRSDISRIQTIQLSFDGNRAFCGRENSHLVVLDLSDGKTLTVFDGVDAIYESCDSNFQFWDKKSPCMLSVADGSRKKINRISHAFLDVLFVPGFLVTTESDGPVRCFSLDEGKESWRYTPNPGRHVLKLGFNSNRNEIVGVEWSFMQGGEKRLVEIAISNGRVGEISSAGCFDSCAFTLSGSALVTNEGAVFCL